MAKKRGSGKNKKQKKGWKPDSNLPRNYYDPITGLNSPTDLYGTPLLGRWEWMDGDTISWELTANSKAKASLLGAESSGIIDISHTQGVPENPWGSPMVLLDLYRSAYQDYTSNQWEPRIETRITDKLGSLQTGLQNHNPSILEATKNSGPQILVYDYGGPLGTRESKFSLLDSNNTAVAWGLI